MKAPLLPIEPTTEWGVWAMGVYPGEGKGEELMPARTPIARVGMVGKPASVPEGSMENVSKVHCRDETQSLTELHITPLAHRLHVCIVVSLAFYTLSLETEVRTHLLICFPSTSIHMRLRSTKLCLHCCILHRQGHIALAVQNTGERGYVN